VLDFWTAKAVRKDLVISSQGLRGSSLAALSGAAEMSLIALETWTTGNEIND